ncbi:MAG: NADH-quinone oxidoreductase subunit L [Planctomycetes bacterium]|nr:NADH-quinone oxidoreductase subunit L [Planctomycetota bacterium]
MNESTLTVCSILILLGPLLGAVVVGVLGRPMLRGRSHFVAIAGVAVAVIASFVVLDQVRGVDGEQASVDIALYEWIATGVADGADAWFKFEVRIDRLTALMLVTVTFISLLVIIYSRDYMRHHDRPERGYERFFAFLALFVFSMCALVLAGNFLLLYLGWELVGLCSYLLIGFYYHKPSAAAAAKKAFLVNRIGDFGFGLGILLIYLTFGQLSYEAVFGMIEQGVTADGTAIPDGRLAIIALLLLCGAVGKSAQLPLHVWLPDAMEGPSPVSALIHAATMVTAGVYMVARCGAIFTASPMVMTVVAILGASTALFAATIALTQHDMKRILAYSTISQLGYMFLGLGVYAASSAMFHLFTHAFFKALLFLSAGSIMHAMGGVIDLRQFGGLRRLLPWTFRFFLVGSLALAGFPFLSGFWSKDEIIHHAFGANFFLGLIALVTAVLTAFYTFRMVFRCFWGEQRVPEGVQPHESGKWMLVPLGVLAAGAVLAGYFSFPGDRFGSFLEPATSAFVEHGGHGADAAQGAWDVPEAVAHGAEAAHGTTEGSFWANYGLMFLSGVLSIVAISVAYLFYVVMPWMPPLLADLVPRAYRWSYNKYFVDQGYDAGVVKPLRTGGRICFGIDEFVVDGLIWLVTAVPRGLAYLLRTLQGGALQGYGLTMAAGMAIIMWWVVLR